MSKRWYAINVAKASGAIDIRIFDDIGGWGYSAADFSRDLEAAGKGDITLRINTPGGDVFQGFAIYNIMSRIRDRVTVVIEGLAASMGSVISMAGKKVIMPENAMMMIHDPAGMAAGGPEEMASFADALDKMRDSIVKAYVDKTGLAETKIRQMMATETWLSAQEAVNMGFADEVEKPIQMAAHAGFNLKCYRNVPAFGTSTQPKDTTMKKEEIARLCTALGNPDLAATVPEGKSFDEVMALVEAAAKAAKKKEETAAAGPAAQSREEVRDEVLAEVGEITALCGLAGFADKASGFIKEKKSVSEVIVALDAAKKAAAEAAANKNGKGKPRVASANTEVDAHHHAQPHAEGSAAVALDPMKVWDNYNRVGAKK